MSAAPFSRVALVGLGQVFEAHIAAYRDLPDVELVAVVEPRAERREAVSARYGLQGFADCETMVGHVQPDIAVVMTPVATHRAVVATLAGAGIHILCEKPLAVAAEDGDAIVRSCADNGVELQYGASYRYLPAIVQARELIRSGRIGKVRVVQEQVVAGSGAAAARAMGAVHYPEGGPGGGEMGLVDHGIHFMDIIPWLADSPIRRVLGRGNRTGAALQPEFATIELQSGAIGSLLYDEGTFSSDMPWEGVFSAGQAWVADEGFSGRSGQWQHGAGSIRVHGDQGALRIFHYANKLFLTDRQGQVEIPVSAVGAPAHFGAQLLDFIGGLRAGTGATVPAGTGVAALRALLAVYDSAQSGCWAELSP